MTTESTINVDRPASIVDFNGNPFFADIEQIDLTNPFSDTNVFVPGLTIDDLPPRPSRPPMIHRLRIKQITDRRSADI